MLRWIFTLGLMLSGCNVNEAELQTIRDSHLAELASAQTELKRLEALDAGNLREREAQLVALGGQLPVVTIPERKPLPAPKLPPESPLEQRTAHGFRTEIGVTHAHLKKVESQIADLQLVHERSAQLDAAIEARRGK